MSAPASLSHRRPATIQMPHIAGRGGHGGHTPKGEKPKNALVTLRRLWGYLRRQKSALLITAVMVAATVGLDLLGPILLGRAIDSHIVPRDLPGLWRILALMLGVYASSALLNYLQNFVMAGAAQRTMRDIRGDLFNKLQHLPLSFFDKRIHGELMARLTSDVESINQVLSNSVTQIVAGCLSTVGVAIAMFIIDPRLAAASMSSSL